LNRGGPLARRRERARRARHVAFLESVGADQVEHSDERLLDHLLATRALLADWGARTELCDAALFHSVYGTQFLQDGLLGSDRRDEVRTLIGAGAEELAWLWHAVRRESLARNLEGSADLSIECRDGATVALSRSQFDDLVSLMLADAVEQLPRRGPEGLERQRRWLTPFLDTAMPPAAHAARDLFARLERQYAASSA
jgi:hypothetical protein